MAVIAAVVNLLIAVQVLSLLAGAVLFGIDAVQGNRRNRNARSR